MEPRRRILITGLATTLGGLLAERLEADDRVEYVGGIDLEEPTERLVRTEFIRADLRNPLVAKVIQSADVDTIVHLAVTASPAAAGGRSRMKELNVIGSLQLLGAAGKAPRLRSLVMKSSTAVYGSSHQDPALFREDREPDQARSGGYERDVRDVESYARAFSRRRRDVDTSILRFANFMGAAENTPLTAYLSLPVVPTVLGHDSRIQLVHTHDAVEVLARAALQRHPGIFNVAGPGVLYLSQAIALAGRVPVPVPQFLAGGIAGVLRRARVDFSPEQLAFLRYGRVADTTRLREQFGYQPRYSTRDALMDFIEARLRPLVAEDAIERAERRLASAMVRVIGAGR